MNERREVLLQTVYFDRPGRETVIVPKGATRAEYFVRDGDAVSSGEVQIQFWGYPESEKPADPS